MDKNTDYSFMKEGQGNTFTSNGVNDFVLVIGV